jgi:hypothetical protein
MYFSRLEVEANETMAAEAARLAGEVDGADVAVLAADLERLAEAHARSPFSEDQLQVLVAQYGSAIGELVRARAGGEWGVGRLFGEEMRGWLLVGERAIKFCPWLEARDRIAGRAALPLAERIDRLCERAFEDDDDDGDFDEAPRLYPLQANTGYFDAGVTRDGRQVLMAAFYPMTFAIYFASDGKFLEYVERPNATHAPNEAELKRWQVELGFEPRTIRVEKFSIEDAGLGIENFASHDEDFLDDPESEPDEGERAERLQSIRRWIDKGSFVLYWGNDLWLDGTGRVTSS